MVVLHLGEMLAERYGIKGVLGRGGYSVVYFAYDWKKKRNCAIKETRMIHDGYSYHMVQKEVELIQRLKYPYFPSIEEVIEGRESNYIVMEYLEGENLEMRLQRLGPQDACQVARWARDLCLMLGYLHRLHPPVIYCDIKPSNVMLQPGGNLRLVDFGAAILKPRVQGQDIGEGTSSYEDSPALCMGTRGYAAPEQFRQDGIVDDRTDIYGVGVTMYRLLTGADPVRFPCGTYGVRAWKPGLPRKLEKIVRKCTMPDPSGRYCSCQELKMDLEFFLSHRDPCRGAFWGKT